MLRNLRNLGLYSITYRGICLVRDGIAAYGDAAFWGTAVAARPRNDARWRRHYYENRPRPERFKKRFLDTELGRNTIVGLC